MADRYLLESGSPDGYLLENSSGVLILEQQAGVAQLPAGFLQSWSTYQRDRVQQQPQGYNPALFNQAQGNTAPTNAWVQQTAAYARTYSMVQPVAATQILPLLPLNINQFVYDWRTYQREVLSQQPQDSFTTTLTVLPPAAPYVPVSFKTPWRVDGYYTQQPADSFLTTVLTPPPAAPFVPPANVRPLQYRTEGRVQVLKTLGANTAIVPYMPQVPVRPLQYRTAFSYQSMAASRYNPFTTPHDSIPPAPARQLQTRQGWLITSYSTFQVAFSNPPPTDVIALAEPIPEFWDLPPYPRQQPPPNKTALIASIPRHVVFTPSGGIIFGGTANYQRAYKWTPSGGIVFSGNASYTSTTTGQVVPTYIYNRRFYTKLDGKR